jgi:hypothetical protein
MEERTGYPARFRSMCTTLSRRSYTAGDITSWVKIKNPHYSQAKGRHEQFTKFRHLELR